MLEDIIRLLHEGKHSLVVSNGEVRTFDRRGVADLYALLQEDSDFLKGASVADKVVGKAAAALGGINEVVSIPQTPMRTWSAVRPSTCLPIAGYASVTVRQSRTLSTVQRRDGARWKLVAGIALLHRIVSSELKSL